MNMNTINEERKNYEIGFLLKSEDKKTEIKKILEGRKVEVVEEGVVTGIKLAYPIKKENFAYFGYIRFLAEPLAVKEIDSEIKHNPELLRHLVTIYPADKINKARKERRNLGIKESVVKKALGVRMVAAPVKKPRKVEALTNEDLEKKLEEILE